MVKHAHTLDWLSADIVLLWRSPKNIRKPADIYIKLWGLFRTINTTSADLQEQLNHADNRTRPIISATLAQKNALFASDDFPLISYHPTQGSYHDNPLISDMPFYLTISFGGAHIDKVKSYLEWLQCRLTLENTGFSLPSNLVLHECIKTHAVNLPAVPALLDRLHSTHHCHTDAERTFLIEMPANFDKPNSKSKKTKTNNTNTLSAHESLAYQFIYNCQKRLMDWFAPHQDYLQRYFDELTPHLMQSIICLNDLHEYSIDTLSKSTPKSTPHHHKIQRHIGLAGWLTVKGVWAVMDEFWDIMHSIHLLGQRTQINGLGYILPMEKANHAPPDILSRLLHARHIRAAVDEVLNHYDLEPEWDEAGRIMQADGLTDFLLSGLLGGEYGPSPTTAFDIAKPHGGVRRIEQLSQHDMMVHRLIFRKLSPLIDSHQSPLSLGFRRGYSREMAKDKIHALMKKGFGWVIEADIEDFFNSVPLSRIWQQLTAILPSRDKPLIELIQKLMQVPYVLNHEKRSRPTLQTRSAGLMQGSPLSPILANLYLAQLDCRLQNSAHADHIAFLRYADDVLIFCKHHSDADSTLQMLDLALFELGLNLSIAKTSVVKASDGFEFLGYRFDSEGGEDKAIVPILKQKKPVILTGSCKYIGINGSALQIRERTLKRDKKTKTAAKALTPTDTKTATTQHILQVIPLRRISQLIVMGNHTLSSPLLSACAKAAISVHFVNEYGFQIGTMTPINAHYFGISAKQYHRHQKLKPSERVAISADIVHAKINNYQTWIENSYRKGDNITLDKLADIRKKLDGATDISQIMGYEGLAAKLCFERLQMCFIDEQKSAFTSRRRSRGGQDRLNSLLNFGYYWLFTKISALLRSHGLNPYLSFLHESEQDYETLVYDIMELFRVQVDKTVLRLVNRKQIQAHNFHLHEHKGWLLNNDALHLFINQLQATFTSQINDTVLEDIILIQIRTLVNWAVEGKSLIWFYWYNDKDNKAFMAHDDKRMPMTIDHIDTQGGWLW